MFCSNFQMNIWTSEMLKYQNISLNPHNECHNNLNCWFAEKLSVFSQLYSSNVKHPRSSRSSSLGGKVHPLGRDIVCANILLLCLVFRTWGVFDDTVVDWGIELRCLLLTGGALAVAELLKSCAEFLWHGVVYDGVDGTVGVDAHAAEEQKPSVEVWRIHEWVHHHQSAIRHPEQRKQYHDHRQHLSYLQ